MKTSSAKVFFILSAILLLHSCSDEPDVNVENEEPTVTLPSGMVLKSIPAQTFTMGSNTLEGSPSQQSSNPEHQVTIDAFNMSETEVSNAQYVEFLNAANAEGLVEISVGSQGPDQGKRLVVGSASSGYSGKVYYNLDGTRVMKDHLNQDGDNDQFTGEIEPENPLNISYIGYDVSQDLFYIKDPYDVNDFNWKALCEYQNYGASKGTFEGPLLNDFDDWAGAGKNLSNELQGWSEENTSAASNLPSKEEVANYPVTFLRWYGATAFASYYGLDLPTEAQWECVAKGGQNFKYAVHDGVDISNANWNKLGLGTVATGHVLDVKYGTANPYGVYNLGGNAWEWMKDHFTEPLGSEDVTNPLVEQAGSSVRSWRGGSWNYHQQTLQSSIRFSDEENRGNDHFGFRVVKND